MFPTLRSIVVINDVLEVVSFIVVENANHPLAGIFRGQAERFVDKRAARHSDGKIAEVRKVLAVVIKGERDLQCLNFFRGVTFRKFPPDHLKDGKKMRTIDL